LAISECGKCPSIYSNLDIFQRKKQNRMRALLEEIEKLGQISLTEFLSYIAVRYGIRRTTGFEYLDDWVDGGYITIQDNIIKFVKKPEWWK
jgi:hypothetical protein